MRATKICAEESAHTSVSGMKDLRYQSAVFFKRNIEEVCSIHLYG